MATPYEKIQRVFHASFQSKTEIPFDLEIQFLINAIGDFSLDLYEIEYNDESKEIVEDLSQAEINLLGKLMYKYYLSRERDRMVKLSNIVGKDIQLTGMGDSKRVINLMYENVSNEIASMIHKLKTNTYE